MTRLSNLPLLPTDLVGSYAQPEWLIRRDLLAKSLPARVRRADLWSVSPDHLAEALDDAVRLAVHEQERAGIDIITDGEARRESYSNHLANALDGIDHEHPGQAIDRTGAPVAVPRVVGPIRRRGPVEVDAVRFLRAQTDRPIKVTIPGPFTMAQQAQDDYYGDRAALAMGYAAAVNEELLDLYAAGADIVQIDEPYLEARPEEGRAYAVRAIDRALQGAPGPTMLHICFGYGVHVREKANHYRFLGELADCTVTDLSIEAAQPKLDLGILADLRGKRIHLGVIDLRDPAVETPQVVAERVRAALRHVPAEQLAVAPDCGMKYIPRARAYGKMASMVEGTRLVRATL
ncbi:MAG: 5-methyltetrahydropteroyltriglutamate--homocysteine methyltransferase [Gammaproteobacteria bacterium PRO9]|nr:5-methyltetrahydropteroyltriglutamate--homocysteine methyltransferase [Gammaproteobacteria bacterium PRO9]